MKKILLVLVLIILSSARGVSATDFEDSFAGIAVSSEGTFGTSGRIIIEGHIDLLVLRSDFENEISSSLNNDFTSVFPNYLDFDYLSEDEWISYCAFVEDANCHFNTEGNFFEFATSKDEYKRLDDIKFIHVDSSGNTIAISEIYNVPDPLFFQDFSNLNYYDLETNEFESDMSLEFDDIMMFVFGIVLFFAVIFAVVRTFAAYLTKLHFKMKLILLFYYIVVYVLLFIVGFMLLSEVSYLQNLIDGFFGIFVYLSVLGLIESLISYFILFRKETYKRYIKYVLISYGSMFIAFILFLQSLSNNIW